MTDFIKACIKANQEIYTALKGDIDASMFEKTLVGAGGDVSSGFDLFAEEVFVKHLGRFGQIESEESGIIGEGDEKIIIDPIDGSANILSGFPYYGTSVAKTNSDGIVDDAIVCNLGNEDIFLKSKTSDLRQGKLFSDDFHPASTVPNSEIGLFEKSYANPKIIEALDNEELKFRSPGAVAVSLAYAWSVNYVLFIGEFRIYDFAAGLALCEGLAVIVEADYVIVSKDKNIADKIELLIKNI